MKIFVCIQQVPDTETRIKIKGEGPAAQTQAQAQRTTIDTQGIKWIINPYDEFAIEEALRWKEARGGAPQVIVLSLGPKSRLVSSLRGALAMGCDEALLIDTELDLDSLTTARALAQVIETRGDFSALFTGMLSIDSNDFGLGPMLAELLHLPHVGGVSRAREEGDHWIFEREVEGGTREVFEMKLPGVITTTKGLNKPRFASLPNIMKAKKKPLEEISLDELGLSAKDVKLHLKDFQLPPEKPPAKMISGDSDQQVAELVRLLREEAKVL